jgi:hypothetical protein
MGAWVREVESVWTGGRWGWSDGGGGGVGGGGGRAMGEGGGQGGDPRGERLVCGRWLGSGESGHPWWIERSESEVGGLLDWAGGRLRALAGGDVKFWGDDDTRSIRHVDIYLRNLERNR